MNDADWNATTKLRRTSQKPIGWQLRQHDVAHWNTAIDTRLQEWRHDWTMNDLREVFTDAQHLGCSRIQRNSATPPQSATATRLRDELHRAPTHAARLAARHALWRHRHDIQKEKNDHRWTQVLDNL